MRKRSIIFSAILLAIVAITTAFYASGYASGGDDIYYVNNSTGHPIGTVTLYSTNGSHTDINVDATYSHHTGVSAPVNAIKVNGVTLNYPNQGPFTLPSGYSVRYNWYGGSSAYNNVGLFDPDED